MEIRNKTIILTGASGGIGQSIATRLAEEGARLLLLGRNSERLRQLQKQLKIADQHRALALDLASAEAGLTLVAFCREQSLSPDVLINNAGVSDFQLFLNQSPDTIEELLQINLISPLLICRHLLPLLAERPESALINIGSSFGSIGYPGFGSYCASKFGLRGFSEALRRELADGTTRVCCIAPRATRTRINSPSVQAMNQELGNRVDDPERVADEVVRALRSGCKRDRYIGWPEKLFVRLNALLPRLVDSSLRKQLPIIRRFADQRRERVQPTIELDSCTNP